MSSSASPRSGARDAGTTVAARLDTALVALAGGNRRMLLEVVRDDPAALSSMGTRLGMTNQAVSRDLSLFHSLEYEDQLESLTARYDPVLLAAAAPGPGERVLDIGCGSGATSRSVARCVPRSTVVGVDVSFAAIDRARARSGAEGLANTGFEHGDLETHPLAAGSFDVAVSRFGAMYFTHPEVAFTNIARALRPDGRLALLVWRDIDHNEWMTAVAGALAAGRARPGRPAGQPGAFGLADAGRVEQVLTDAGFTDLAAVAVERPVVFGPDADWAYALVSTQGLARDSLDGLGGAVRQQALADLRTLLADHQTPDGVLFRSSAWLITARRP